VRIKGAEPLTIGRRAASKLLVEVLTVAMLLVAIVTDAFAQAPAVAPPASEPFAITDNSFFVEEAFNQEARVFQNIVGALLQDEAFGLSFTQEWPAPSIKHQLSYTATLVNIDNETGPGDVLLNYRYQLFEEGPGRPAVSPRVSLIVPVGDEIRGLGQGSWGLQFNLPVSKQVGDFYLHGNAGVSWWPSLSTDRFPRLDSLPPEDVGIASPFVAGSVIYRVRPMFNLMIESVVDWGEDIVAASRTARETSYTFSPGARGGWNIGEKQVIVGLAVPVTRAGGETFTGVFAYFSYELPF
jgi:hypothetical protein